MAEAKTKEQREAEWWADWRREDFSWDGLAKKEWLGWSVNAAGFVVETANGRHYGAPKPEGEGDATAPTEGRAATLQDYWRADPKTGRLRDDDALGKELVRADDQPAYHICHLPLFYENGASTGKLDWADDALDPLVNPRLLAAAETKWLRAPYTRRMSGADLRGQFQGGVWLSAAADPLNSSSPISVRYEFATFTRDANFDKAAFSGDALFYRVAFSGDVSFDSATFSGDAWFESAAFSGDASFSSAAFSVDARFTSAAFSGEASFYGAAFSSVASFISAAFSSDASFTDAAFSGDASFTSAAFSSDASFIRAAFSGDASFARAAFSGDASFKSAAFSSDALFNRATFSAKAIFARTAFSGETRFSNAVFSSAAGFRGASFAGLAIFDVSSFEKTAHFDQCVFNEMTQFDGVTFSGDVKFTGAIFNKLASFEALSWPQEARHWHSAFDKALFHSTLVLSLSGFRAFAAFDGATLERGVQIDEASEKLADATFKRERKLAIDSAILDGRDFKQQQNEACEQEHKGTAKLVSRREIKAFVREMKDARLRELERGCRVLKLAMEQASNKSREQLLYRFELQARRAQRNLPLGEKTFSYLYAAASDYGASMWRPFAALALLIMAFAAAFFGWSFALGQIGNGKTQIDFATAIPQALDLSWANVFKPLSALSNDFTGDGKLGDKLIGAGPWVAFAVRGVATLESLLAIVLAFLFALAVRRRFQIS